MFWIFQSKKQIHKYHQNTKMPILKTGYVYFKMFQKVPSHPEGATEGSTRGVCSTYVENKYMNSNLFDKIITITGKLIVLHVIFWFH